MAFEFNQEIDTVHIALMLNGKAFNWHAIQSTLKMNKENPF